MLCEEDNVLWYIVFRRKLFWVYEIFGILFESY